MAVPNTNTFTQQDVKTELGSSSNGLVSFFTEADDAKFDPAYKGSKNSLLNFRNYNGSSITLTPIVLGYSASTSAGACALSPTATYYIDTTLGLGNASLIFTDSSGTTLASSGYYSNGSFWRQWNAATQEFTGSFGC